MQRRCRPEECLTSVQFLRESASALRKGFDFAFENPPGGVEVEGFPFLLESAIVNYEQKVVYLRELITNLTSAEEILLATQRAATVGFPRKP